MVCCPCPWRYGCYSTRTPACFPTPAWKALHLHPRETASPFSRDLGGRGGREAEPGRGRRSGGTLQAAAVPGGGPAAGPGGGKGRAVPHLPGGDYLRWELWLPHHMALKTTTHPFLPLPPIFPAPRKRDLKALWDALRLKILFRVVLLFFFFLRLLAFQVKLDCAFDITPKALPLARWFSPRKPLRGERTRRGQGRAVRPQPSFPQPGAGRGSARLLEPLPRGGRRRHLAQKTSLK